MTYHKIRGIDKMVCTAEAKIAYNLASTYAYWQRKEYRENADKYSRSGNGIYFRSYSGMYQNVEGMQRRGKIRYRRYKRLLKRRYGKLFQRALWNFNEL